MPRRLLTLHEGNAASKYCSMHSKDLTKEQAAALTAGVLPCLRYLGRLRTRCEKRFAPDDPLYQAVFKAYDAVHGLRVMVHYLECDAAKRKRKG